MLESFPKSTYTHLMDTARLFIAFALPDEVQQHLAGVQTQLAETAPHDVFRWINPHNTHITLHFLGDTHRDRIPAVIDALQSAAGSLHTPEAAPAGGEDRGIRCRLGGPGYFPHIDKPRVIWLGLNEVTTRRVPDLHARGRAWYQALERELTSRHIDSDSPRYAPHITLGYRRRQTGRHETAAVTSAWQGFTSQGLIFTVSRIVLFESVIAGNGREHHALHSESITSG